MNKKIVEIKLSEVFKMVENGEIRLDYPSQRGRGKWTTSQISKLVGTVLKNDIIPTPVIYSLEDGDFVIDGLQRLTSLMEYRNDEFALTCGNDEWIGKKFSELSKELQEVFDNFSLVIMYKLNATSEAADEAFGNLNNGTNLSEAQKSKGDMGRNTSDWFNDVCKKSLFTNMAKFTNKQLKDNVELECLIQGIMLVNSCLGDKNGKFHEWKNISKAEYRKYSTEVLSKATKEELASYGEVIDYLSSANVKKGYEKTFIPVLFVLGKFAMMSGLSNEEFNKYVVTLVASKPDEYSENMGSGNVGKKKTTGRLKSIIDDFKNNFSDLDMPEICYDFSGKSTGNKEMNIDEFLEAVKDVKTDTVVEEISYEDPVVENNEATETVEDNSENKGIESDSETAPEETTESVDTAEPEDVTEDSNEVVEGK